MFVNTLPYISNPIDEFKDFKLVSWERDIYSQLKGEIKQDEIDFYTDLIIARGLKRMADFGVGCGRELYCILWTLERREYSWEKAEANEVDEGFIMLAGALFYKRQQRVLIHRTNWLDLPKADPPYEGTFDFALLTGNSLTYIGGGTREYTKKAQQIIVNKFAQLIEPGGYFFIDSRNYDYIRSLMNLPTDQIFKHFLFGGSVYYHGRVLVFPAYISDTVVVLHYYDKDRRVWSKLDLYPIYQHDMIDILSKDFTVECIYHDFKKETKEKSLFIQYLARRK